MCSPRSLLVASSSPPLPPLLPSPRCDSPPLPTPSAPSVPSPPFTSLWFSPPPLMNLDRRLPPPNPSPLRKMSTWPLPPPPSLFPPHSLHLLSQPQHTPAQVSQLLPSLPTSSHPPHPSLRSPPVLCPRRCWCLPPLPSSPCLPLLLLPSPPTRGPRLRGIPPQLPLRPPALSIVAVQRGRRGR